MFARTAMARTCGDFAIGQIAGIAGADTQRIKLNLVVSAHREPRSALCASAIGRHV
jgi:hypothetical protein